MLYSAPSCPKVINRVRFRFPPLGFVRSAQALPAYWPLFLPFLLFLLFGEPVQASVEKDFLAAREAQQKGRFDRFEAYARKIPADQPLQPYLGYWRLRGNGRDRQAMLAFIAQYPASPLSEKLKGDLARQAARQGDWTTFASFAGQLTRMDTDIQCHAHQAALSRGVLPERQAVLTLYLTAADQPSACEGLFTRLFESGLITAEDRYARLRLALDTGNLRLVRQINTALPAGERFDAKSLARVDRHARKLVVQAGKSRAQRELALHALGSLAREDAEVAARLWESSLSGYGEAEQGYGWGQIAMQAARRHDPRALDWFARAGNPLSEMQSLWKARTTLRAGRWNDLLQTIEAMPQDKQAEAVWRYWKGRAYKALGMSLFANQIFARLSREIHYYGLLAEEELPLRLESQPAEHRVTEEEVQAVQALPGIQRALLLREWGLLADAVAEWDWTLRGRRDVDLLAAAELARRDQWYDRAIITAERTEELHDFDLRYLTPYRDLAQAEARENNLDEAWVFGLIRQESRFVAHARSRAGAQGLMQIMPATAGWIAKQMGLGRSERKAVHKPETNIRFGTYYLRRVLNDLDGSPVLATAGYNAGPGRARRWQADTPLEGAVYVESIPFAETREYVKKVMANAMYYNRRLGLEKTSLKDRLGTVPARNQPSSAEGETS